MTMFIQGLYGTVIGVSFYNLSQHSEGWEPVQSWDECKYFFLHELGCFLSSDYFFGLCLFTSTLLIISHDWLSYHDDDATKIKRKDWFEHSLPQIFSLFFIGEMFWAAADAKFNHWYAFGFGYTVLNVLGVFVIGGYRLKIPIAHPFFKGAKYLVHLILTIFGWLFIAKSIAPFFLLFTMIVVVLLWTKKKKWVEWLDRNDPTWVPSSIPKKTDEEAAEQAAKKTNEETTENLLALEEEIKKAEDAARSKRIETIEELKNASNGQGNLTPPQSHRSPGL